MPQRTLGRKNLMPAIEDTRHQQEQLANSWLAAQAVTGRQQKKGRPNGRPHIALDCCAPVVHPYTLETSLQLALPAPYKCVGTSLLASLLLVNIDGCSGSVKIILIISHKIRFVIVYINIINMLLDNYIFNILNIYVNYYHFRSTLGPNDGGSTRV